MEKNKENEIHINKSSSSSSDEEEKKEKDKDKNEIENQEEKIEKDNDKNKIINEEEKNEKDMEKNEIINEDEKKSVLDKMKDFFKVSSTKEDNPLKKDENREIEEIISSKGFRVQKHFIKTSNMEFLILQMDGFAMEKNIVYHLFLQKIILMFGFQILEEINIVKNMKNLIINLSNFGNFPFMKWVFMIFQQ